MKTPLIYNSHNHTLFMNISEVPGRCATLLRAKDRQPYSKIIDQLMRMADDTVPKPDPFVTEMCNSKLDIYLTGSALTNIFFDSNKDYNDIDLIGVSDGAIINHICKEIASAKHGKSVFDYGKVRFVVRETEKDDLIEGTRRFDIENRNCSSNTKPIDLTLIVATEFDTVIRKLT